MDNASKEIKEYGMIKTFLPEAGTFERAVPYRENKIKPLFIKMKNQIAALAGKVVELNKMVESWKNKYQKSVEECDNIQKQLDDVRKENGKLSMIINVYRRLRTDMTEWCVFWEQKL